MKSKKPKKEEQLNKKEESQSESDKYKIQALRALADYDNLRKRTVKQLAESSINAKTQLVSRLLPALDMLTNASRHVEDPGLVITLTAFEEALKDEGFSKIISKPGDIFDEEAHEAIEVVHKKDKKDGEIVKISLAGWIREDGFVLRHTKVHVNKLKQ